jgi:peptidoglycan hydrolase-like protein with peptidoglycan-binding domain
MTMVRTLFALMLFLIIAPTARAQEATLTSSEVWAIQEKLFELGFTKVGFPDGKIGPNTRAAISQWQKHNNLGVTGILVREAADYLLELPMPTGMTWGAVSASTDAGYGANWNYSSGLEAYKAALNRCQNESNFPYKCTTIAGFANKTGTQWIVAIKCDQETSTTDYDGIAVASAGSYSEAYDSALKLETDHGYYSNNCYQLIAVAADGSHQ